MYIFSANNDVEETAGEVLVEHFLYAITVFGGDDADECACIFQGKQHRLGFQKEYGVYCHVGIRFLPVFALKTS